MGHAEDRALATGVIRRSRSRDGGVTILTGDALAALRTLEDGSVHMCVTSPPYWGLRDYGTGTWEGGIRSCEHKVGRFTTPVSAKQARSVGSGALMAREVCPYCGARRGDEQLGLEPLHDCAGWATGRQCGECYVCRMVAVFREVRRVLRLDGTLWLNLGDSYNAAGRKGHGTRVGAKQGTNRASAAGADVVRPTVRALKEKDLVGVPWRLALALQEDGWYLRSDIIWSKPNPMPESVTDRPTKAHEYVFLLSKSARYFFDQDAVREQPSNAAAFGIPARYGANVRTVWTIAPQPFKGAHFAVFPRALVERCIRAGTSERGCCSECGAPTTCTCSAVLHPAVVLDPFLGAGTTALVARQIGRRCVGIELNPEYVEMTKARLAQVVPTPE